MIVKSFRKRGGISRRSVTSTVAGTPKSMKRISITLLPCMLVICNAAEWDFKSGYNILHIQPLFDSILDMFLLLLWPIFLCTGPDRTCHWMVSRPGTLMSSGRDNHINIIIQQSINYRNENWLLKKKRRKKKLLWEHFLQNWLISGFLHIFK